MAEKLKTRRQIYWQAFKRAVADLFSVVTFSEINDPSSHKKNEYKS